MFTFNYDAWSPTGYDAWDLAGPARRAHPPYDAWAAI
jgi:hypothetical protein